VLPNLGLLYRRQGRYPRAAEHHQQALALFHEIDHRHSEAVALKGVGETHHTTSHLDQAHAHHTTALTLATKIGDRYEQTRAHNGLAHTHHASGDPPIRPATTSARP
jgi:tetratricopeptide (TPR) repeat protein